MKRGGGSVTVWVQGSNRWSEGGGGRVTASVRGSNRWSEGVGV